MNGQGFGAFMSGLSGGYSLGKSIKGAPAKPDAPKLTPEATAPAVQQGAQQTLGAADITAPALPSASEMGFGQQQEGGLVSKMGSWISDFGKQGGQNG